ncbi:MAG: dihydrofolate reductase [Candidatus Cloacimonadaceae bacterium]|nr:dihydrofolate reductase [Candidatus Cloacimonadaceae bacterium]MDP3114893.1 dihydrofolate reductase [Candidatus Cloacimonadaceae bacterium]
MNGEVPGTVPNLAIIVAMDRNRLIGRENHLPWHIPEDLAYFRAKTLSHNVLMGRNTWHSLGKALERRTNIVLTRDTDFYMPGIIVCHSIGEAISFCAGDRTFVIGGAGIFAQFIPIVDKMYITRIDAEFAGDLYFPRYDEKDWKLLSYDTLQPESGYKLSFSEYSRELT